LSNVLAEFALWFAAGMSLLAVALLLYALGRRGVSFLFGRWLHRKVDRVERLLKAHEATNFSAPDRLLFQLGEVHDNHAVETALKVRLDEDRPDMRPELRKLYDSLGLTERYMKQLEKSSKWAERTAAARALGQLGAVEAIPMLVAAMRDPHEDAQTVKLAAAQALGFMQAERAIPMLIEQLRELDELASPRLAELLVSFGDEALPQLHTALEDESHLNAQVWAAQILGRIGSSASVPRLVPRLTDRSERVRVSATEALGRIGDKQAVHDLIQVAMRDPVPPVRAEAARALGAIGDDAVMHNLVMMLSDRDYWTRLRAIEAIEMLRPGDMSTLERALSDPTEAVRRRAAMALERIGLVQARVDDLESPTRATSDAAVETLVKLGRAGLIQSLLAPLEHKDLRVRARACVVLARVGDKRATDPITKLLKDPMWPVRVRAVEAIAALHPADGIMRLIDTLHDPEESVRLAAVTAIVTMGVPNDAKNIATVVMLFNEGNAEIRCRVIEAIGALQSEEIDALLARGLFDPNGAVRIQAVEAVAERATEGWTEPLIECLSDPDTRVRSIAGAGLGKIGSRDALRAVMDHLSTQDRAFRESLTDVLARQGASEVLELIPQGDGGQDAALETRLAVVWALGKTGDPQAFDALADWATDRDAQVRASVAGAVAKLPGQRAEEILTGMLRDPNERVRAAAVNALGAAGSVMCVDALLKGLNDPDMFVQRRIGVALGMVGGAKATVALDGLSEGDDLRLRAYAYIGLGLLGTDHGFQAALAGLADGAVRAAIGDVLGRELPSIQQRFRTNLNLSQSLDQSSGDLMSADELQARYVDELASNQRPERRVAAVQALTSLAGDAHITALLRASRSDPEPEVRRLALTGLTQHLDHDGVGDTFAKALKDPEVAVQVVAVGGVKALAEPDHNHALMRCFMAGDDGLDTAVIDALHTANEGRVQSFVDELMSHTDARVLTGGVRALGQIGDARATGLLTTWLRSGATPMRHTCIDALGRIGTVKAKDALTGCLGDPDVGIRLSALDRLVPLPRTRDAVMRLCRDPSAEVRTRLVQRVAEHGHKAALVVGETLATDGEDSVRVEAMLGLLTLNTDVATRRFVDLFDTQPPSVCNQLRNADGGEPPVSTLLERAETAQSPDTRAVALDALGCLAQQPVELLLRAMQDPEPRVRIAAINASHGTDDPELIAGQDTLLRDPDPTVRAAVRKGRMKVVIGGSRQDDEAG